MQIDRELFDWALSSALSEEREGIGRLGEKTLHRTLKYYFEPDKSCHEIKFCGSVADIKNDRGIIEIQTRSFNKLLPKLEKFLETCNVTVVYPIVGSKTICKVDPESGETSQPRRSPKKGRASSALAEIAKIREFIPHERLTVILVFLDVTETRRSSGAIKVGRQKTTKIDTIPSAVSSFVMLKGSEDYKMLIPETLSGEFSSKEFEKATGLHKIDLHGALMLLLKLGIVSRTKDDGKSYTYRIID